MSVIVKGMEMPTECADCWFHRYSAEYGYEYCSVSAVTNFKKGDARPKGCPLVEAPEWISVEERFPEIDTNVLVYAIGKIDGFIGDTIIAISKRCVFRLFPWSEGIEVWENPWQYFTTDYDVTHWMPLPEPPKEDKP